MNIGKVHYAVGRGMALICNEVVLFQDGRGDIFSCWAVGEKPDLFLRRRGSWAGEDVFDVHTPVVFFCLKSLFIFLFF
jgi:hypothetical protein